MVTLKINADVNVEFISQKYGSHRGNTMDNTFINGQMNGFGETIQFQWCWVGAPLDDGLENKIIDVLSSNCPVISMT